MKVYVPKPYCVLSVIFQELSVFKAPGEKLGMSIKGGAKGAGYNPNEKVDEGIFISKVSLYIAVLFHLKSI